MDDETTTGSTEIDRAVAAEDEGRFEEALAMYDALLATDPQAPALARLARFRRACVLLDLARFREALDAASAIAGGKQSFRAAVAMLVGAAARELGELDRADAAYREATTLRPSAEALSLLAVVQVRLGRDEEAERFLRDVLALEPDYQEAHFNLGAVLQRMGRHEDALASFERAVELDAGDGSAHAELGFAILGELGRTPPPDSSALLERAEAHLTRAVALDPDRAWSHIYLGNLLWRTDRLEEAADRFAEAVRLAPQLSIARRCYASVLRAQGRDDDAAREVKIADALDATEAD